MRAGQLVALMLRAVRDRGAALDLATALALAFEDEEVARRSQRAA
jgi:hypothetical protein